MNWKSWPYWVRGGVIIVVPVGGLVVADLGCGPLVSLFLENASIACQQMPFGPYFVLVDHIFRNTFLWNFIPQPPLFNYLFLVLLIPISFLIGAFFGWLYGKIKKKST